MFIVHKESNNMVCFVCLCIRLWDDDWWHYNIYQCFCMYRQLSAHEPSHCFWLAQSEKLMIDLHSADRFLSKYVWVLLIVYIANETVAGLFGEHPHSLMCCIMYWDNEFFCSLNQLRFHNFNLFLLVGYSWNIATIFLIFLYVNGAHSLAKQCYPWVQYLLTFVNLPNNSTTWGL